MYVNVYRNIFFCIIQLGDFLQVSFDIIIIIILFPPKRFLRFQCSQTRDGVFPRFGTGTFF